LFSNVLLSLFPFREVLIIAIGNTGVRWSCALPGLMPDVLPISRQTRQRIAAVMPELNDPIVSAGSPPCRTRLTAQLAFCVLFAHGGISLELPAPLAFCVRIA